MSRLKELQIFIHTYGRSDDQQSLQRLSPAVSKRVWLVVQKREAHLYTWPKLMVLPDEIRMLSPTRQYILENAKKNKIIMMDDDLAFYRRKSQTDWHLRYCEDQDIGALFRKMSRWLDNYAHCGISPREGNNRVEELSSVNTRMMRILGYNRKLVSKTDAHFDRLDTKQDFDMTLQLLRAGYPNIVSYEFAQGQWRGSNAAGGCAEYRTEEMMSRCAQELADLHPGFVRVTEKKTKSAWQEFGGVRKDVIVYWKKAYASSKQGELKV